MALVKKIKITAHLNEVGPVSEEMAEQVKAVSGDDDLSFRINIGLTEALTNAILHGCVEGEEAYVSLEYHREANNYIFKIDDPGKGPEADMMERREVDSDLLKENQRGTVIINWAVDEAHYHRTAEGFHLTLVFEPRS